MDSDFLLEIYTKEIRPLLEFGAPVWSSSLTRNESMKIEKVQKDVFKLISPKNSNYEEACRKLSCDTLANRRQKLCLKFATKEAKRENSLFTPLKQIYNLRNQNSKVVEEFRCRHERYYIQFRLPKW